jgi:hypothetical protein
MQLEARLVAQVLQIGGVACEQVIHRGHGVSFRQQGVAQMGTKKPGSSGHYYA